MGFAVVFCIPGLAVGLGSKLGAMTVHSRASTLAAFKPKSPSIAPPSPPRPKKKHRIKGHPGRKGGV